MEKLTAYLKAERGRLSKLAAALEINPSAISQWDEIPLNRVIGVERCTGIPRQELRPDFFGASSGGN
jgi:DNA-binding transcriptional regulator YdaS (Cro superfamily)